MSSVNKLRSSIKGKGTGNYPILFKNEKKKGEKKMKKMTIKIALGLAAGLIMAGSVSAMQVDTNTVATTVDQALTQMQQEMINKNYSAMLLKNEMRAKMMADRTPQNYMQASIQPVMMEKMRAQIKPQQMQVMTNR